MCAESESTKLEEILKKMLKKIKISPILNIKNTKLFTDCFKNKFFTFIFDKKYICLTFMNITQNTDKAKRYKKKKSIKKKFIFYTLNKLFISSK